MVAAVTKQDEGIEVPAVVHGMRSIFLDLERWEFAKKVASMLAASSMVPKQFQGADGVGNCMIAMNLAERMGVDVFMLMQTLYVVHGRPGLEGKLVIALVNGAGRFEPLEFEEEGEGKTKKGIPRPERVRAFAKELKSKKVLYGPWVSWAMAEAEGWTADKGSGPSQQTSKWHTIPELMFRYRSAAFFARTFCPEVLMGLRAKEELEESPPIDVTPIRPELPPAKPGEVVYEVSKAPEEKKVEPATSNLPVNGKKEEPKAEAPATEKETDKVDEKTKVFLEEAEKYHQALAVKTWLLVCRTFGIRDPQKQPLTEIQGDMRQSFLERCKVQLDKQNQG